MDMVDMDMEDMDMVIGEQFRPVHFRLVNRPSEHGHDGSSLLIRIGIQMYPQSLVVIIVIVFFVIVFVIIVFVVVVFISNHSPLKNILP